MIGRRRQTIGLGAIALLPLVLVMGLAGLSVARAGEQSARSRTAETQATAPVLITLHAVAVAERHEVTIGDVATLDGADDYWRRRIAALDLAEAPRAGKVTSISHQLIAYRIQLAGIDSRHYRIEGARSTTVTSRTYVVPESDIVEAVRQYVVSRLPWRREDLAIELSQPIRGPVVICGDRDSLRFQVSLPAGPGRLGRLRADVAVYSGTAKHADLSLALDVRLYQTVAVASRRIERGQPINEENVYFERRAVDPVAGYLTESESPVGQRAKRTIMPLHTVTRLDVDAAEPAAPLLVRQRDIVQLVARTGGLVVTTSAEALQDGHAGQVIRVRNTDSKAVVTGRVVSRNEVQVTF
jgi:flagella basal body P-ring formation protein FlgA